MDFGALSDDVLERARRVRLVLTDCDGVLTDGCVHVSEHAEELKSFSLRDGMGVERLRVHAGIETGILTREVSGFAKARARKLSISELHTGVHDKAEVARSIAARKGLGLEEVAYLGDDVNDLGLLRAAGLSACPSDAFFLVLPAVRFVCPSPGGRGAFRDLAELVLFARRSETPL